MLVLFRFGIITTASLFLISDWFLALIDQQEKQPTIIKCAISVPRFPLSSILGCYLICLSASKLPIVRVIIIQSPHVMQMSIALIQFQRIIMGRPRPTGYRSHSVTLCLLASLVPGDLMGLFLSSQSAATQHNGYPKDQRSAFA